MLPLPPLKFYRRRPLIPNPILEELHVGWIYGAACGVGELCRAGRAGESDEELIQKAKFYDYLEVQPLGNNEFLINDDKYGKINTKKDLEDLNRKVIEIADKAGMPCCATSDAHYMFAEDQRNRDILLSNWEKPGKIESHPPVYIRTTQEMLDEFSYLPKEKAMEIVVTNTRKIAEQCEVLKPLAEEWKSYNPKIAGADEKLVKMCYEEKGETVKIDHEDNYETPRVELHLHTKMSLDGLIDNEEIIKTAAKWHHPAVAITDHGVIQAFPKIQDLADKYHQKVIYGMEGYMIDEIPADPDADRQQYGHIIILAKNITGLRNLYRMVAFRLFRMRH